MKTNQTIRKRTGSSMPEFAAALSVLVCFLLVPVVGICTVPARFLIAQCCLNHFVNDMALSQTRKDAVAMLSGITGVKASLSSFGVDIQNPQLTMVVCDAAGAQQVSVQADTPLSPDYLPNGSKGPCVYALNLAVDAGMSMPGAPKPVQIKIQSRAHWENTGRDPANGEFYLNEVK